MVQADAAMRRAEAHGEGRTVLAPPVPVTA